MRPEDPGPDRAGGAAAAEGRVWHYAMDGEGFGPVDRAAIGDLVARGLLDSSGLVWREGWGEWRMLGTVEALRDLAPVTVRGEGGAPSGTRAVPASGFRLFALRLAAALLDQLLLLVPSLLVVVPAMLLFLARGMTPDQLAAISPANAEWWILFGLIWSLHWVYAALMESSAMRGTLGKRVCGLVVSDLEGKRLTFGRASGRYWAKVLSSPFYIGYVIALATGGARALHDMIAGTAVVERRPVRRRSSPGDQRGAGHDRGGLDPHDVRSE